MENNYVWPIIRLLGPAYTFRDAPINLPLGRGKLKFPRYS